MKDAHPNMHNAPKTWVLVAVGALLVIAMSWLDLLGLRDELAYIAAGLLMAAAVALALGWRGGKFVALLVLWAMVILLAFLVVPDPEEAVRTNRSGLNWWSGLIAAYLLFCIWRIPRGKTP